MKRLSAVLLVAALLASCRSSQPTTNPFLRTTVPPPATAQGMMVMPGEPIPTPGTPAMTPVVPAPPPTVVPQAQQAPLIAPPPPQPKQDRFQPPGGSYLYHQSSNDRPAAPTAAGVPQAGYVQSPATAPAGGVAGTSTLRLRTTGGDRRGDPPEKLARVTAADSPVSNSIRIVDSAAAPSSAASQGVFRVTAGDGRPSAISRGVDAEEMPGEASRVSFATSASAAPTSAGLSRNGGDAGGVAKAVFQPADASDYAHALDYRNLRGRLEYSQSQRQWKLRYIPIDGATDAYGGSVVLADSPALRAFKPGDMVVARGKIVAAGGAASGFSGRYELESIEPLSR